MSEPTNQELLDHVRNLYGIITKQQQQIDKLFRAVDGQQRVFEALVPAAAPAAAKERAGRCELN